jgi:hypothetical protein
MKVDKTHSFKKITSGLHYLTFVCEAGKINTMGRVILRKNVSEKLSIINPL